MVLLSIGILISVSSCKTTKKREDVSKAAKAYQNTTSYYNGYFNAEELYQNSLNVLNQTYKDDYQKILPVYTYRAVASTKPVSQDLDKVVEKLSRVINLKRASDWVDDSYLLLGKAQYLKQDFEKAEKTFEYFSDEMNPAFKKSLAKLAKKKSDKTNDKNKSKKQNTKVKNKKVLKKDLAKNEVKNTEVPELTTNQPKTIHSIGTPKDWNTYNEGLIWMAKTYIERDKLAGANYLISRLESEPMEDDLKKDFYLLKSYYYLEQKKYDEAIKPLISAVGFASSSKEKARYSYILGQLFEKQNNTKEAYEYFKKVGEYKPDYDLEFNAKLKLLKNYSGKSDEYAMKELKQLLNEDKYAEYLDIIYYTMGEAQFNKNNIPEAITSFNLSLRNNNGNSPLKAETYYKLGNIKFDNQEFVMAKKYFDSCLVVMAKNDERYNNTQNLSSNLTEIAINLETITLQDSLIKISKMSKDEQMALATGIRKKQLEEEVKRKTAEKNVSRNLANNSQLAMADGQMGLQGKTMDRINASSFFAYNETARKTGVDEFIKKWGNIRLEDNWRRSNKSSSDYFEETKISADEIKLTDTEMNAILGNYPRNPEQVEEAELKIRNAMLQLGILYREKLLNYDKSVEILEKLLNRFSGFTDECKAMYFLQMSYKDIGKFENAESWVSKMKNTYPDCVYSKILTDPEFTKKANKARDTKAIYYENIYNAFTSGNYDAVQTMINKSPVDLIADQKYKIKIDFIQAKITGKTKGKDEYILALEDFLKQYPDSKEAISVRETLRFIKGDKDTFSKLIYEENIEEFTYEGDKMHYIVVIIKEISDQDIEEVKTTIANYNNTYYKLDRLKLSNIYFDTKGVDQIILMRKFDTAEGAMKYYNDVKKQSSDFIRGDLKYEIFAISQKNYREIIKQKSVEKYKIFFNKNYIEQQKK